MKNVYSYNSAKLILVSFLLCLKYDYGVSYLCRILVFLTFNKAN